MVPTKFNLQFTSIYQTLRFVVVVVQFQRTNSVDYSSIFHLGLSCVRTHSLECCMHCSGLITCFVPLADVLPANGTYHSPDTVLCSHPVQLDLPVLDSHRGDHALLVAFFLPFQIPATGHTQTHTHARTHTHTHTHMHTHTYTHMYTHTHAHVHTHTCTRTHTHTHTHTYISNK